MFKLFPSIPPPGIEDLVAAVLGVDLREHHQFGIGGVAAQLPETCLKVRNLLRRQGQGHFAVGPLQRLAALRQQGNGLRRPRTLRGEQFLERHALRDQVLGHAVEQLGAGVPSQGPRSGYPVAHGAFDSMRVRKTAQARDLAGLCGPGRDAAAPGQHQQHLLAALDFRLRPVRPVVQQLTQAVEPGAFRLRIHADEVKEAGAHLPDARLPGLQTVQQLLAPERGECAGTWKRQHPSGPGVVRRH